MAKKDYHKPPEDPRTIGGELKQRGRERREQLQTMIPSRPSKPPRNDIRPDMQLIDIKITDLRAPAHDALAAFGVGLRHGVTPEAADDPVERHVFIGREDTFFGTLDL